MASYVNDNDHHMKTYPSCRVSIYTFVRTKKNRYTSYQVTTILDFIFIVI